MIRTLALATLFAVVSLPAFAQEETAPPPASPAEQARDLAASLCAACHGPDGNSPASSFPRISGHGKAYIIKQLADFKATRRSDPSMDGTIAAVEPVLFPYLADWFSQQKSAGTPPITADDALIERGKRLWRAGDAAKGIPACAACHGTTGAGLEAQYPRLSAQYPEYLEKQILAFRNGERSNDPESMMRVIAERLLDKDVKAVSAYAAGLR
ncbi:MAG: c-type cytochrome [Zoogloeaceae bacterium]|jgi:cytochrome c553|nr:c-type cytochrome [Zoogloeaceae bacterium]